jgi:hypothetical protein
MHLLQFRRRQPGLWIAFVKMNLVVDAELFEEPENALGAGMFQVMDGDHGADNS